MKRDADIFILMTLERPVSDINSFTRTIAQEYVVSSYPVLTTKVSVRGLRPEA